MLSPMSNEAVFVNPIKLIPQLKNRTKFCKSKLVNNNINKVFKNKGLLKLIEISTKSITDRIQTPKYKYESRDSIILQK